MSALGIIQACRILCGATEAEFDAGSHTSINTLDAGIGVDVSAAGSPGPFYPTGKIPGTEVQRWEDRGCGITVGFPVLTMLVRRPTKDSRITKVVMKVTSPTLAVTAPATGSGYQPAPAKAYECSFIGEFVLPERSTRLERIKFLALVVSMFMRRIQANDGNPTSLTANPLHAAVVDGEAAY